MAQTNTSVKRIRVTINGMPPGLLMNSKNQMVPEEERGKATKQASAEEKATLAAHWTGTGKKKELALPWEALYKAVVAASAKFRFKGQERMTKMVAATIACETDMIPLGTADFRVDSRWGRVPPKTGGMVMIHRAHLAEWQATFTLIVDDEFYPAEKLQEIFRVAGKLVGILANRPANQGPYGKFTLEGWEPLD